MLKKTVFFLLMAVLSPPLSAQTAGHLPQQIGPPSDLVWVSASLALQDGRLESAYFEPSQFEMLSAALMDSVAQLNKAENQGCAWRFERKIEPYPGPPASLRELVLSATTTALAVVEEMDSGFWLGHPSTLLRLRISETSGADGPTTGTVLVFLMQGNVQTEEGPLCGNFSNRSLPERGDQVRLLSNRPIDWSTQEPTLLFPHEYYFLGPKAVVPPALYARELLVEPAITLSTLLEEAAILRAQGGLQ